MSNEEIVRRAETKRTLLMIIRMRQLEFLGHFMRKNTLEELILTGSVDGKISRGRQREKYLKITTEMYNSHRIYNKAPRNFPGMINTITSSKTVTFSPHVEDAPQKLLQGKTHYKISFSGPSVTSYPFRGPFARPFSRP